MPVYTLFGQAGGDSVNADTGAYTLGMEFSLSGNAVLTGIWFYSPAAAAILPGACAIFAVAATSVLPGTENDSPAWSGGAGSGWVKCAYSGPVLAAGVNYRVAVQSAGGSDWFARTADYWDTGPGSAGLTSGIISAPDNASSDVGQDSYEVGALAYPGLSNSAPNYWVDVEVTVNLPPPPVIAFMASS